MWHLLDLVNHLSDCSTQKHLNQHLREFALKYIYPRLGNPHSLYIALPFWSENEIDPETGQDGYWTNIPCFVKERKYILSYAVFFACIGDYNLNPFSFTKFIARQQVGCIPLVVQFQRKTTSREGWPSGNLAEIHELCEDGYRLIINVPYLPDLEVRPSSSDEDLINLLSIKIEGGPIEITFEKLMKQQRVLSDRRSQELRQTFNTDGFKGYWSELHNYLCDEFKERLHLGSWKKRSTRDFARFCTTYSIIPDWQYVYHLPSKVTKHRLKKSGCYAEYGSGGPIFATRKEVEETQLMEMAVATSLEFRGASLDDKVRKTVKDITKHALRSAVAAIMARNMSHHEGSHIIPRARVSDICQRYNELFCLKPHNGSPCPVPSELIENLKNQLDEYIQKKQDFLAEITSEPLTTTKTARFYQDIIAPLIQNVLFMDTIAANEGVRYFVDRGALQNRLLIKVYFLNKEIKGKFSCDPSGTRNHTFVTYPDQAFPYTLFCSECNPHSDDALLRFAGVDSNVSDFSIELPGSIGEHAFYAFLENLIRNAAKHNLDKLQQEPPCPLEIRIEIADEDDEFYQVDISDNLTNWNRKKCQEIGNYLKNSLVEPTGELRKEAWGIAEMKVSSALLKGSTDWTKLEGNTALEFLSVHKRKVDCQNRLAYRFYMMKPKKVCALLPDHALGTDQVNQLRKDGIWLFQSIEEMSNTLLKGRSIAAFKFAVLNLHSINGEWEDIRRLIPYLPFRVITQVGDAQQNTARGILGGAVFTDEHEDFPALFRSCNTQLIITKLWRLWLSRWTRQAMLDVYFEQEQSRSPTSQWIELVQKWGEENYQPNIWYNEEKNGIASQKVKKPNGISKLNDVPRIIFDRHAIVSTKIQNALDVGVRDSYYVFDKLSSDFISIITSEVSEKLVYALLEAGLLRILIVDSRIAERSCDENILPPHWITYLKHYIIKTSKFPCDMSCNPMRWHVASIGKVFICTHFNINGKPTLLHPNVRDVPYLKLKIYMEDDSSVKRIQVALRSDNQTEERKIEFSLKNGKRDLKSSLGMDFDMIIIHQGDIDTRKPSKGFNFRKFVDSLKQLIPFVIIDSGRGIPVEVQRTPNVKFLPYSLLGQYVAQKRIDKVQLTEILMSLTRRRSEQ